MNRRKFISAGFAGAGLFGTNAAFPRLLGDSLATVPRLRSGSEETLMGSTPKLNPKPEEKPVAFTVPPLPYAFDALEPYIDAKTMEIHHDKHHGAYVANLNKALEGNAALEAKSIDDLLKGLDSVPENIRNAVRNNGGGHWNHTLFWTLMKKGGGGEPKGSLAAAINSTFSSFAGFQEKFAAAGLGEFGSGGPWLFFGAENLALI